MHQGWAMRHRLRLFTGDEADVIPMSPHVTVKLGDISRALVDANRRSRTWLDDFADDEIKVSADLYEVISAYLRLRPGA